jgi:hypothetical protein
MSDIMVWRHPSASRIDFVSTTCLSNPTNEMLDDSLVQLMEDVGGKGAPGFECRTGGLGGGEASEGLKNFTKVRLNFYF